MQTIELLIAYQHTPTRLWRKGDRPTVSGSLAKRLIDQKIARPAEDEAPVMAADQAAKNGITQEEFDAEMEAQKSKFSNKNKRRRKSDEEE